MLLKQSTMLLLLISLTVSAEPLKKNQISQTGIKQLMPQPSRTGVKKMTDAKVQTDATLPFVYVMSVQWVGPLVRMSYSAEWNLLWRMDLSQPNDNDEYKSDTPATIQRAIVVNSSGKTERQSYLSKYVYTTFKAYGRPMVLDPDYFFTVKPEWPQLRPYDQHIMLGTAKTNLGEPLDKYYWAQYLPGGLNNVKNAAEIERLLKSESPVFNEYEASRSIVNQMSDNFDQQDDDFNPQHRWADAVTDADGRAVSMVSLHRALSFLANEPKKTAWVMAMDAPDFPKDEQPSENCALLILASPDLVHPFPRKPLATIYTPIKVHIEKPRERFKDIKKAVQDAAAAGKIKLEDIGMFFHDATMGSDASSDAIRSMGQALTESIPGFDFMKETYSVDKYLKNAGAASAAMNMAFATAYVHHTGKPAMIIANREADKVYATLVTPPPGHVVPAKKTKWPRAGGGGQAYSPWWGDLIQVDDKKRKQPLKKLIEPLAEYNAPLGTVVASGETCPQSGAWRCIDTGTGYNLIPQGAAMPMLKIPKQVSGKSEWQEVLTKWQLVRYQEEQ